jgi:hypothetical protein
MRTEYLIALLAANLEPVDARRTTWRYALGMTAGALAALILTTGALHVTPALPHEVSEFAFWVRELYCASLGMLAVLSVARLGRPGTRLALLPTGIAVVVLIMLILAAISLISAASRSRVHLLLSRTFAECPFLIAFISAPLFFSHLWILQDLAPTRLRWAGAGAASAAGAIGLLRW